MSTRRKHVAEVTSFPKKADDLRPNKIKGKIIGCGWVSHENVKMGSYFLIQDGPKIYRCLKDKGVYDPRQFGLTVEVTGEWLDDMLIISSIKRIEDR